METSDSIFFYFLFAVHTTFCMCLISSKKEKVKEKRALKLIKVLQKVLKMYVNSR